MMMDRKSAEALIRDEFQRAGESLIERLRDGRQQLPPTYIYVTVGIGCEVWRPIWCSKYIDDPNDESDLPRGHEGSE